MESTLNPKSLNPTPLNPKSLNPKSLSPKPYSLLGIPLGYSLPMHFLELKVSLCTPQARKWELNLRTLGGTPNGDPCSLWGLIWGLPRDVGVI